MQPETVQHPPEVRPPAVEEPRAGSPFSPLRDVTDLYPASAVVEALHKLAEAIATQRTWMKAEQAAEFLGVNHSEFKSLAAAGEIPRHSFQGKCYRYNAHELTAWLLAR